MTIEQMPEPPEWDVADRMRKALRHADLGVGQMAEWLGVAPNTVSTWINGRIPPSRQTLRLWAMRCGVPLEWLTEGAPETGKVGTGSGNLRSRTPLSYPQVSAAALRRAA